MVWCPLYVSARCAEFSFENILQTLRLSFYGLRELHHIWICSSVSSSSPQFPKIDVTLRLKRYRKCPWRSGPRCKGSAWNISVPGRVCRCLLNLMMFLCKIWWILKRCLFAVTMHQCSARSLLICCAAALVPCNWISYILDWSHVSSFPCYFICLLVSWYSLFLVYMVWGSNYINFLFIRHSSSYNI